MKKLNLIIGLLLLLNVKLLAQTPLAQKTFTPVSPVAAALGSYGDIPISYYTGTPEVKVPVYNIKTNNINFPIDLNYHCDGRKILGEATFVGLDWSLSNTGVITRSVSGLDDFSSLGYFRHNPSSKYPGSGKDPQPDIFCYNFNGKSGKFVIDYPGTIRFLRREDDIKIQLDGNENFNATTEDGTIYYFTKREYQTQTQVYTGSQNHTHNYNIITAWYLTSIVKSGGETVDFNYINYTPKVVADYTNTTSSALISVYYSPQLACINYNALLSSFGFLNNSSTLATHSVTDEVLVDNIVFKGGIIKFYYSDRLDLNNPSSPRSQKLDKMVVLDLNNNVIQTSEFAYDYYNSFSGQPDHISKRLKLTGYKLTSGSESADNYSFYYNTNGWFPDKIDSNYEPFGYDRTDATNGILSSIRYPTGGMTNFLFENHASNGMYGARIKRIENRDANYQILSTKVFDYTKVDETTNQVVTTGRAISYFVTTADRAMQTVVNCDENGIPRFADVTANYRIYSQASMLPLAFSSSGAIFAYDQVTVFDGPNGENGKTVYYYYNTTDYFTDISVPGTHDQNNGLLLKEEYYKNTGAQTFVLAKRKTSTPLTRNLVSVNGANWSSYSGNFYSNYVVNTQASVTQKDETWVYYGANTVYQVNDYVYHPSYQQVSSIKTTSSIGEPLETIFRHPYEMTGVDDPSGIYQDMTNNNIINNVISEQTKRTGIQTNYKFTNYYTPANGIFRPQTLKQQVFQDSPLETLTSYTYSSATDWNIESVTRPNGSPIGYIWGYNKQYPIAEIKNALRTEVAFTSFENVLADTYPTDDWQILPQFPNNNTYLMLKESTRKLEGRTGRYACNAANIQSKIMPLGNFTLTIWAKGSGVIGVNGINQTVSSDWSMYTWNLNNITQVTIASSSSIFIDELRLLPPTAQMSTYTYDPLVGMTSETDAKGMTSYYEYDSFQRLKSIKDKNGNTIKAYEYHYKQ